MKRLLLVAALIAPTMAHAQTSPNVLQGQVWSTQQWNSFLSSKADVSGGTLTNPTITGGNASGANVTATGSTTARSLAARAADVVNAKDFGVKCDDVTNDTADLQLFLNAITAGKRGVLPEGTCLFSSTLNLPNSYASLFGSGMYSTTLEYIGVSTTADLIAFGAQAAQTVGLDVEGFRVTSSTRMTSAPAAAIHIKQVGRSIFRNVVADGQDGNGNLWNGLWFDQVDDVHLIGYEAVAQNDAVRVNGVAGSGMKSDLWLSHGKIGASGVGLHVGGAFGGLVADSTDDIGNGTNVLIDTVLATEGNRELFFNHGFLVDSATTGDGYYINDSLTSSGIISIRGWVASSAAGSGIHVVHWNSSRVNITTPTVFNNKLDGIRVDDSSAIVNISPDTMIRDNQGYGINATVATSNLYAGNGSESTNTLGPVSADAVNILTKLPGALTAPGILIGSKPAPAAITATTGATLTAADIINGAILRSGPTAGFADTTDAAANIVAAIPGVQVNDGFDLTLVNETGFTLTLAAGTGVTLAGTTTVSANSTRRYRVTITATGTPAVTITGLMQGAN